MTAAAATSEGKAERRPATVSVVIPAFNAGRYLGDTLRSVLNQTYQPDEVLVIDDGSMDDTAEIGEKVGKPVRVVRQANTGECGARNRGIEEAVGRWIAFLDADDVWEPTKLERQMACVEEAQGSLGSGVQEIVCVHTGFRIVGEECLVPDTPPDVIRGDYSVKSLLLNPLVNTSTAMIRGGLSHRFPTWAKQGGDMIFFAELSHLGRFIYVDEVLAGYRMHGGQVTKQADAWIRHFENRFRWIRENCTSSPGCEAAELESLLKEQVLEWLRLARWNRQWNRYWALREYAGRLNWDGGRPTELDERVYPRSVYWVKDVVDRMREPRATPR
ncbi:MAG TPA: glycosyltransferase family A protein [Pirellulales bacterium]|nr:glycosyltransferase family A protein [Pirellulales bacterium]